MEKQTDYGIFFVLYTALSKWEGSIFLYFLFLQATILQNSIIHSEKCVNYSSNYFYSIPEDREYQRFTNSEAESSNNYGSELNSLNSSINQSYEPESPDSLSEPEMIVKEILRKTKEMKNKFSRLTEKNKAEFGDEKLFSPFGSFKGLPHEFFSYHLNRLTVLHDLIYENNDEMQYRRGIFQKSQQIIDLRNCLNLLDTTISEDLNTTIQNIKMQSTFESSSKHLSEMIWKISSTGDEFSLERTFSLLKIEFVYSCIKDQSFLVEFFYLDKEKSFLIIFIFNALRVFIFMISMYALYLL